MWFGNKEVRFGLKLKEWREVGLNMSWHLEGTGESFPNFSLKDLILEEKLSPQK